MASLATETLVNARSSLPADLIATLDPVAGKSRSSGMVNNVVLCGNGFAFGEDASRKDYTWGIAFAAE
jgi:hypothetical protein